MWEAPCRLKLHSVPTNLQPLDLFVDVCPVSFRVSSGFWARHIPFPLSLATHQLRGLFPTLWTLLALSTSGLLHWLLFHCREHLPPAHAVLAPSFQSLVQLSPPLTSVSDAQVNNLPNYFLFSFLTFCTTLNIWTCHVYLFGYLFYGSLPLKLKLHEGRHFVCLVTVLPQCLELAPNTGVEGTELGSSLGVSLEKLAI